MKTLDDFEKKDCIILSVGQWLTHKDCMTNYSMYDKC